MIEKNKFSDRRRPASAVDLEGTLATPLSKIKIESNSSSIPMALLLWKTPSIRR